MEMVHIQSAVAPLDRADVAPWVAAVLRRADAMGLIEDHRPIDRLDVCGLCALLRPVAGAGIGVQFISRLARPGAARPAELQGLLRELGAALMESPAPRIEWKRTRAVLGVELLGRLVGVSPSSLQRYADGRRDTPASVAARLHFLALLCGDLLGAYNELGVRLWFDRPRVPLGNKTPAALLARGWLPQDEGPARVSGLATSLLASSAT